MEDELGAANAASAYRFANVHLKQPFFFVCWMNSGLFSRNNEYSQYKDFAQCSAIVDESSLAHSYFF